MAYKRGRSTVRPIVYTCPWPVSAAETMSSGSRVVCVIAAVDFQIVPHKRRLKTMVFPALLVWALCAGHLLAPQQDSSTAHAETLIQRLGTGNIRDEDAAKLELQQYPTQGALSVLLKALPSSDATVRDDIIDILSCYKDNAKIPALLAYRTNGWGERNVNSQLVELGAPAVDALIKSLPESCERRGRNSEYANWVGTVLREIEPEGTRAMLAGLVTQQPCVHEAARSGLVVPRPGPGIAPPVTTEDEEMDAGLFLLVDAA